MIRFKGKIATIVLAIALFLTMIPAVCFAEVKEIIAEGTYTMGDGETPVVAEARALEQAKRMALEQAGTYVESYSQVKNYQLTADEVTVLAAGIMKVQVLDEKRTVNGNGIDFWVKIRALVDSDKIEEMAAKVKDKETLADYQKLQEEYSQSQQEIANLKQQLQQADSQQDKNQIQAELTARETDFMAASWFGRGKHFMLNGEYERAREAFTHVISLRPRQVRAYFNRGQANYRLGYYEQALSDFRTVLAWKPGFVQAYLGEARCYDRLGQPWKARAAYREFLVNAPPGYDRYVFHDGNRMRVVHRRRYWRGYDE
jgi:Flp pilus assembly protein TadD